MEHVAEPGRPGSPGPALSASLDVMLLQLGALGGRRSNTANVSEVSHWSHYLTNVCVFLPTCRNRAAHLDTASLIRTRATDNSSAPPKAKGQLRPLTSSQGSRPLSPTSPCLISTFLLHFQKAHGEKRGFSGSLCVWEVGEKKNFESKLLGNRETLRYRRFKKINI